MAREPHDDAVSIDQDRMIVGGEGGEHGVGGEGTSCFGHLLPIAGPPDPITFGISTHSPDQTDEAGEEQRKKNWNAKKKVPFDEEGLPKTEHDDQISPEKELGVVPFPRSEFDH